MGDHDHNGGAGLFAAARGLLGMRGEHDHHLFALISRAGRDPQIRQALVALALAAAGHDPAAELAAALALAEALHGDVAAAHGAEGAAEPAAATTAA